MDISDYRKEIDIKDKLIVDAFVGRMDSVREIAKIKKENGMPVNDPKREREKMRDILEQSPEELQDYTRQLYELIFGISKSYQNRLNGNTSGPARIIKKSLEDTPKLFPENATVACQGVEGAYSEYAADKLFKNADIMFFSSFKAVFSAIEEGICSYGVIPIENSTAGSVNAIYDLMRDHSFSIVRSIRVKIEHNLLAKPGTKLEDIREIYSHEQAINQCSEFLGSLKNVKVIPCENTAVAAKMAAESDRNDIAALASSQCMKYYNLKSLKNAVQNNDNNYTRFICISGNTEIYPGADRTSLMVTLPHEPGTLYNFLSYLYVLGINLIKLESRPLPDREFEFMFYFDIETPVYSPRFLQLLKELPEACDEFQYLGSYSEVIR